MKRIISAIIYTVLLLTLGAAALAAWPGQDGLSLINNPLEQAGSPAELAAEQTTTTRYNAVAMSLDATANISNAQALANEIAGTQSVLRWSATAQAYEFWLPGPQIGSNFTTTIGTPYFVEIDNTNLGTFTLVGDVPPQSGQPGAVQFALIGGPTCQYNFITLPLDFGASVTTASELVTAVGDVDQVLRWNPTVQGFEFYFPGPPEIGANFPVTAGYPYWLCMTASKSWPTGAP